MWMWMWMWMWERVRALADRYGVPACWLLLLLVRGRAVVGWGGGACCVFVSVGPPKPGRALARFIAQGYIMGEQGVARVFRMEGTVDRKRRAAACRVPDNCFLPFCAVPSDRQRLSSYFSVAAETAHEKMTELDARFGILDKTAAMMDFAAKVRAWACAGRAVLWTHAGCLRAACCLGVLHNIHADQHVR